MDGIQSPIKADLEWKKDRARRPGMLSAKPTPSIPLWNRLGITRALPAPIWTAPCWTPRAPITGCRWISMSAASSTLFCTCCTRAFTTSYCATKGLVSSSEPFKSLLCQGMVLAESFYKDNGWPQRVVVATGCDCRERRERSHYQGHRNGDRRRGSQRRRNQDVESQKTMGSTRRPPSTNTVPTPCACSRCLLHPQSRHWSGAMTAYLAPTAFCASCGLRFNGHLAAGYAVEPLNVDRSFE